MTSWLDDPIRKDAERKEAIAKEQQALKEEIEERHREAFHSVMAILKPLSDKWTPIVNNALSEMGARKWGKMRDVPLGPEVFAGIEEDDGVDI